MSPSSFLLVTSVAFRQKSELPTMAYKILSSGSLKFILCHSSLLLFIQIGLLNIFQAIQLARLLAPSTFACNSAFIWSVSSFSPLHYQLFLILQFSVWKCPPPHLHLREAFSLTTLVEVASFSITVCFRLFNHFFSDFLSCYPFSFCPTVNWVRLCLSCSCLV